MAQEMTTGVSDRAYGAHHAVTAEPSGAVERGAVSKPFHETAPEIQGLVRNMFGIYSESDPDRLYTLLSKSFAAGATFDLPFAFMRGTERVRVLWRIFSLAFDKVVPDPKLVTVQMINRNLGRVDVEATVRFYPRGSRTFPLGLVLPEYLPLDGTWTIVAKGDDDRIISLTETPHNWIKPPQFLRSIFATAFSTAGMALTGW